MRVRAAVVQAASIGFERQKTMDKLELLVFEAARGGAQLAVFPEAFVPAYPRGIDFGTVVGQRTPEGRDQFRGYFDGAIEVPGPDVDRIASAARKHGIHLVVGSSNAAAERSMTMRSSSAGRGIWASVESSCRRPPNG